MKKGCVLAVIVGIGAIAFVIWDIGRIRDWGIGVDTPVEWLPKEARDITFIEGGLNKAAEFTIAREAFEDWASGIGKPVKPLGAGEWGSVMRANLFLQRVGAAEALPELPEHANDDEAHDYLAWDRILLQEGDLFYKEQYSNNGGYWLGYEVKTSRGYFFYSHN